MPLNGTLEGDSLYITLNSRPKEYVRTVYPPISPAVCLPPSPHSLDLPLTP